MLRKDVWFVGALVAVAAFVTLMVQFVTPIYQINSGSMEPTLPVGARVVVMQVDELEPTDIITFRDAAGDVVTHTFLGYEDDGSLKTKGDANPTPDVHDVPLQMDNVIGKVILTTQVFAPSFWLSKKGIAVIIIVVMMYIFLQPKKKEESSE